MPENASDGEWGLGPSAVRSRDTIITQVVEHQDAKPEEVRAGKGYTHLSSLLDTCSRKGALLTDSMNIPLQHVNGARRIVWKMGRAAEKHVRDSYIEGRNYKGVTGVWKCDCKSLRFNGFWQDHQACSRCGSKAKNYNEATLLDQEHWISGNPDMLITEESPALTVVEIKSMQWKDFEPLTTPLADHVLQGMGYRRIALRRGISMNDHIIVFYVCKEYRQRERVYKEFVVPVTPQTEAALDIMWTSAMEVRAARQSGFLPERLPQCTVVHKGKPKSCPVAADCFTRNRITVGDAVVPEEAE